MGLGDLFLYYLYLKSKIISLDNLGVLLVFGLLPFVDPNYYSLLICWCYSTRVLSYVISDEEILPFYPLIRT